MFLLALAVLDDLIAILIIAFFFTTDASLSALGFATVAIALFGAVSRLLRPRSEWILGRRPQWPVIVVLVVLAVLAWYFVYRSGVHATIAGVALGLVMSRRPGGRAAHELEPWSNGVILPLFAFTAAMVPVPQVQPSRARSGVLGHPRRAPGREDRRHLLAGGLGASSHDLARARR